jgi:hypothetical protein
VDEDNVAALFPNGLPLHLSPEIVAILRRLKDEMEDCPKFLPEWADGKGTRGATPNEIVRSALFTARNRATPRRYFKDEPIVVTGGGSIVYQGEELRQDDELVWMRLIQLAKARPLGEPINFTPYSFLKSIGWQVNNWGYQHLKTSLLRMKATAIQITANRLGRTVVTGMIDHIEMWDPVRNTPLAAWEVCLSKVVSLLFADQGFTIVDLEQRKALPEGIATKLHSFWSSHKEPYPARIETLQRLCGSSNELRFFRRELKKALSALIAVGFLKDWRIEGALVFVTRNS